jgi:insecticidal toxin complex protein TccC
VDIDSEIKGHKPNISYITHNPSEILNFATEESKQRITFVETKMKHTFIKNHALSRVKEDSFFNIFKPHTWIFKANFRNPAHSKYYASDVARHQYINVSTKQGFFGVLPSTIKREHVINKHTIEEMTGLKKRLKNNA